MPKQLSRSLCAKILPVAFAILSGCDVREYIPCTPAGTTDVVATFMVGSDLHYLSPSLMTDTSSADLRTYLANDPKMLVQSPAILHSFLDSVRSRKPRFLLITGDMTKDGEKRSHQEMADSLATLRRAGIAVYVIPGNHDVENPESQSYGSGAAKSAPSVTGREFAQIYRNFGYNQAIARDTASLSYVADLLPGVRLLAMDPTRWRDNLGASKSTIGGRFLPQTTAWIRNQLRKAKADGKLVVGAMHHGILEHFSGQATNPTSADYVVAGFDTLSNLFADEGLRVVFTGHFHANDIVSQRIGSQLLTDIETGSLVTAPSTFRVGFIRGSNLSVATSRIKKVNLNLGMDFQTWALENFLKGTIAQSYYSMRYQFGIDSATATMLAPVVASAYAAHNAGNEVMTPTASGTISLLESQSTPSSNFLASSLKALFTDLGPSDASGVFSLR